MSFPLTELSSAFSKAGCKIELQDPPICKILNSVSLPKRIAKIIISSKNYYPVFSQNRDDGDIEFTVIPFAKHARFNKEDYPKKEMSSEELWESIESTHSLYQENVGKPYFSYYLAAEKHAIEACTEIGSLVADFVDELPSRGTALDLGCGPGANALPLLIKGWNVIAVDKSPDAIAHFKSSVDKANKKFLESGQLVLIQSDITAYAFTAKQYDVIICQDVLPYIHSKKLRTLMRNIHDSLTPKGHLVGSLFFTKPTSERAEQLMRKIGAHFYKGEYLLPALLEHSGFEIEEYANQKTPDTVTDVVNFIARKSASQEKT